MDIKYQSADVTLNAQGAGTVFVGPTVAGVTWTIINMATSGNSARTPQLAVYRGSVAPQYLINGTMNGNIDANTDRIELFGNEKLACQYTGGTAGALMTVNIAAEQKVGR